MKKYKHYIVYICSIIALISFTSCNDFLEEEPISSNTTGNAFKGKNDIDAALIGVYESFYMEEYYYWDFMNFGDVRSDNAYAGGDDPEINQYDNLNFNPLNSRVERHWRDLYNAIMRANLLLDKIDEVDDPAMDEKYKEDVVAQAKFLRAMHYFQLAKLYGGVPIIDRFGEVDSKEVKKPRASEEEVYNFIIEDLEQALVLPDSWGNGSSYDHSRATKGAVNALLAKVYAQKPNADYEKVIEHADAVLNSSAGYSLHSSYEELFDGKHYDNSEAIFQIQFIAESPESNWGPQMLLPPSISGDDWRKHATPSKDLVRAFEREGDDIRYKSSVLWEDVDWSDEFWKPCSSNGPVPFAYKWKNADGWESGDYIYLLRVADIILIKAEAKAKLGENTDAIALVNQIRNRVNLDEIPLNSNNVEEIVLNERRLELLYEGERWYDLARNGKLQSTFDNLEEYTLRCNSDSKERVQYNLKNVNGFLPIPQTAINRNENLEQNSGY